MRIVLPSGRVALTGPLMARLADVPVSGAIFLPA
jgi:hypothetical protein